MTTLAQILDCHSCNDERSMVQKKNPALYACILLAQCAMTVRHHAPAGKSIPATLHQHNRIAENGVRVPTARENEPWRTAETTAAPLGPHLCGFHEVTALS